MELHFLLREAEDRGGFPADETCEGWANWNPEDMDRCTLSVSPVKEDMKEVAAEIEGEFEKLIEGWISFLSENPFFVTKRGVFWGKGGSRWTGVDW